MSLDKSEVKEIAGLVRLTIEEQDISSYGIALSSILDLVDQMNAAEITDISPATHPDHLTARLREDDVTEKNQRDHFQKQAPLTEEGYYLVPKIIE